MEPLPEESFAVVERIIHPRFKYMLTQPDRFEKHFLNNSSHRVRTRVYYIFFRFDVALLRLHRPVRYKANILPICLPPDDPTFPTTMTVGIVSGRNL